MSNVLRNSFLLQWHLHIIKIDRIIYTNTSVPALQMESSKYLPGLVALSGPTMGVLLPSPPTLLRMALLSRLWQETWQVRKSPHDTSNALLRVIWYKDLHVMIMSCIKSYKAVRVIWCVYISHINQYNYELYESNTGCAVWSWTYTLSGPVILLNRLWIEYVHDHTVRKWSF